MELSAKICENVIEEIPPARLSWTCRSNAIGCCCCKLRPSLIKEETRTSRANAGQPLCRIFGHDFHFSSIINSLYFFPFHGSMQTCNVQGRWTYKGQGQGTYIQVEEVQYVGAGNWWTMMDVWNLKWSFEDNFPKKSPQNHVSKLAAHGTLRLYRRYSSCSLARCRQWQLGQESPPDHAAAGRMHHWLGLLCAVPH